MRQVSCLGCLLVLTLVIPDVVGQQSGPQLLKKYRITDAQQSTISASTTRLLQNERGLDRKLAPFDGTIKQNSHVRQHARFTFSMNASLAKGIDNRRNVIEMTFAVQTKRVPPNLVKPLVEAGFGPQVPCEGNCTCDKYTAYRTADGSCNNLIQPHWGKASIPFRRWLPPKYDDGVSTPRQQASGSGTLPSARVVSYTVHEESTSSHLSNLYTHMMMQWGQFLDHDITSTPTQKGTYTGGPVGCCRKSFPRPILSQSLLDTRSQCFPIEIDPSTDPFFNDTDCMNFVRSVQVPNANCTVAPVEQLNQITAYIDASNVYGSSQDEQRELRTLVNGEMKVKVVGGKDYLPDDAPQPSCNNPTSSNYCFKAGDKRVNENPTLQSMHTLFLWEHNRIAKKLKALNCYWDDEKIFQETRKIVGAQMQMITYNEYLPIVLGNSAMSTFSLNILNSGYSSDYSTDTDASIKNAFAAAAFRFGHSMIRDRFSSLSPGYTSPMNDLLRDIFGKTSYILTNVNRDIDSYFRGLLYDKVQKVDSKLSLEVTNHLFTHLGISFDLAALNIQRGRDHGLDSYVEFRQFCGLPNAVNFNDLVFSGTHTSSAKTLLDNAYVSVKDIDLFTGLLTETPVTGSLVGPTLACLLGKQFQDLKRGDRFWFEGQDASAKFTPAQLFQLRKTTLSKVICDNTNIASIQENAFKLDSRVSCNTIAGINLSAWKVPAIWSAWGPWGSCVKNIRTRTRQCKPCCGCKGLNAESSVCKIPAPICNWSPWGGWRSCTKNVQYRSRRCSKYEQQSRSCPRLTPVDIFSRES